MARKNETPEERRQRLADARRAALEERRRSYRQSIGKTPTQTPSAGSDGQRVALLALLLGDERLLRLVGLLWGMEAQQGAQAAAEAAQEVEDAEQRRIDSIAADLLSDVDLDV